MFTNYRMKFHMKDTNNNHKTFMETDIVRVKHDGDVDKDEERVRGINIMAGRLSDKHMPRFRPQLFACYEVSSNGRNG